MASITTSGVPPPLIGDGRGKFKIWIVGNSGTPIPFYHARLWGHLLHPACAGTGKVRRPSFIFCLVLKSASKTVQTTLGRTLASMLDVPYISLDALYWQPHWKETPVVEFRAKVAHAIENNPDGWVVDGEYGRRLGNIVQEAASDIICTTSSVC
jgi:hypothetical protein